MKQIALSEIKNDLSRYLRLDDPEPTPEVSEAEDIRQHRTLRLDALVRMKLTAFRDKDRMHCAT